MSAGFDTTRRYVRVTGQRAHGFIEFEFCIGEPDLCVEMILGQAAFAEFCVDNAVVMLDPESLDPESAQTSRTDWQWRMFDATAIRFR